MSTKEVYADKIAKLLAKAESTTPEEAELLFAKAQELMAKYSIDEAMLRNAGQGDKADSVKWDEFVTVGIYRHALFMLDYYVLLVNGCKVIELSGSPWRQIDGKVYKETHVLRAVGYESDIEKARLLATSLKLQCMRAETVWWKENKSLYTGMSKSKQHQARRGFMMAFAAAAFTKMQTAFAKAKQSAETEHGSNSVALALRSKDVILKDEFDREYPETKQRTSRLSQGDAYARSHGREAGQRADLGTGHVGGGRKALDG